MLKSRSERSAALNALLPMTLQRDATETRKSIADGELLKPQGRFLALREEEDMKLDPEARTLEMSFSSEFPVERWFGVEVLSHAPGAADLSRLNSGAPLLFNHDMNDLRGVVEKAWIDSATKKGRCIVRFARTPEGDQAMALVQDKVLRNVSFMYEVRTFVAETNGNGRATDDTYTATDWLAYEVSLVTVPADPTVGVGRQRSESLPAKPVHVELRARAADPAATAVTPPAAHAASTKRSSMNIRLLAQQLGINIAEGADEAAVRAAVCQKLNLQAGADDAAITAAIAQRAFAGEGAVKNERERIAAIRALCRQHKVPDTAAEKMIADGVTIEAARGLVLEHLSRGGQNPVASLGHTRVDMTEREARSFSLIRAAAAALSKDWSRAGFEREVSNTIARQLGRDSNSGFFMPSNLPFAPTPEHLRAAMNLGGTLMQRVMAQRATYQVGTAVQGGNLVETDLLAEDFITLLRNISVVMQLGARMLTGLVGNVDIPRQTGATTTYWVGESAALTQSEATFDKVTLRPKTIGALSKMSRLMLLQSTPAIEMLARMDMLAQMALGIDLAALSGSGTGGQPTGVVNQAGVASVVGGANGAPITWDNMIQLYTAPAVANAAFSSPSFAFNARTKGYLATLKSTTGQYLWTPGQGGGVGGPVADNIQGYNYKVSNQLRGNLTKGTGTNLNEVVFGDWSELLIGEWGVMEVTANPYGQTDFATGDVALRCFQTLDIAVRHGQSFAVMSDASTPGF